MTEENIYENINWIYVHWNEIMFKTLNSAQDISIILNKDWIHTLKELEVMRMIKTIYELIS